MSRFCQFALVLISGFACAEPPPPPAPQGRRALDWTPVDPAVADVRHLTPTGRRVLDLPGAKWEQAQSEHFVVHFEREIFARKAGRMAEFLYGYVAQDLQGPQDLVDGRSHIFVFRDEKRWAPLVQFVPGLEPWAFAFVRGPEMFIQPAADTEASASVLAHEMSHLILNRFFQGAPPVWLNEGLAEWYGEFGYAAFKGIKKSRRTEFKRLESRYPLRALLSAEAYPSDPDAVRVFYETARFVVAYLRLAWPEERFPGFLREVLGGADLWVALDRHYGIPDAAALAEGFDKFLR